MSKKGNKNISFWFAIIRKKDDRYSPNIPKFLYRNDISFEKSVKMRCAFSQIQILLSLYLISYRYFSYLWVSCYYHKIQQQQKRKTLVWKWYSLFRYKIYTKLVYILNYICLSGIFCSDFCIFFSFFLVYSNVDWRRIEREWVHWYTVKIN